MDYIKNVKLHNCIQKSVSFGFIASVALVKSLLYTDIDGLVTLKKAI